MGPDRLKSQQLKDMAHTSKGEGLQVLNALTPFCTLVLENKTLKSIFPSFLVGTLVALRKKEWGGGVRPIEVSCTHQPAAKVEAN